MHSRDRLRDVCFCDRPLRCESGCTKRSDLQFPPPGDSASNYGKKVSLRVTTWLYVMNDMCILNLAGNVAGCLTRYKIYMFVFLCIPVQWFIQYLLPKVEP